MNTWERRPREVANLLNPAFCGALLVQAVNGYTAEAKNAAPYALMAIPLPLILHRATRNAMPKAVNARLLSWILSQQETLLTFPDRALQLKGVVREAIVFSLHHDLITIDQSGGIVLGRSRISRRTFAEDTEVGECLAKANFLGRWLGRNPDLPTIFALLGMRP